VPLIFRWAATRGLKSSSARPPASSRRRHRWLPRPSRRRPSGPRSGRRPSRHRRGRARRSCWPHITSAPRTQKPSPALPRGPSSLRSSARTSGPSPAAATSSGYRRSAPHGWTPWSRAYRQVAAPGQKFGALSPYCFCFLGPPPRRRASPTRPRLRLPGRPARPSDPQRQISQHDRPIFCAVAATKVGAMRFPARTCSCTTSARWAPR